MNYNEVYNRLIQRSKLENRFKSEEKYYELHHIALKNKLACLGRKYINKDGVKKKVKPEELDEYFKLGWKLGQK